MTWAEFVVARSRLPKDGTYTLAEHLDDMNRTISGECISLIVADETETISITDETESVIVKDAMESIEIEDTTEESLITDTNTITEESV